MRKLFNFTALIVCSLTSMAQHKLISSDGYTSIKCEWNNAGTKITSLNIDNDYGDKEYEVSSTGKVFTYEIDDESKETYTWTFNNKGYATQCVYKYVDKEEDYSYTMTETITFTYNSQYQITKWSDSYKSVENDDGDKTTITGTIVNAFTYSNNDLTKITHLWKEKEDGETDVIENSTYNITYDEKIINPMCQYTDEFIEIFSAFMNTWDDYAEGDISAFVALGFLGKASYHFPSEITMIDNETEEEDDWWGMSPEDYEFCDDNYLIDDDGAEYEYSSPCKYFTAIDKVKANMADIEIGRESITISGEIGYVTASIYSTIGNLCKNVPINSDNTTIDISDLQKGIYVIKVGKTTRKFIRK